MWIVGVHVINDEKMFQGLLKVFRRLMVQTKAVMRVKMIPV
jgi:hypothetical protein